MDTDNPKVFLNDQDIIEFVWNGDLEWKSYIKGLEQLFQLATELEIQAKPINIIVDFTNLGKLSPVTPQIAERGLKDIPYRRMAGFGIKPEHQAMLDAIKEDARSNPGLIKDFPTREEALTWVKEG